MATTKKAINQAIAQANTTAASKFLRPLGDFIYSHWSSAKSDAVAYRRFLSANQRILKAAYKHDELGYKGDEQLGRWCPRQAGYTFAAPLRVSSGSLSPLPFLYNEQEHCYYVFGVGLKRYHPVGEWAREYKINNGDVYSIVYITLLRERAANYPDYYNFHGVDQLGVITLRVSDRVRDDSRDIGELYFDDVFSCDQEEFAGNFHFPIGKHFGLIHVLNNPDWVIWRQGFGFETVGAWGITHSRRSLKSHSKNDLHLENQRLYGLDYINMLNEFL